MAEAAHPAHSLSANVGGEHRAKAVPPKPYRLVTEVDPALEQEVFDVTERQRKAHVEHDHQADHFG